MGEFKKWLFVAALVLGIGAPAYAQNATCPSSNRMTLGFPRPTPNFLDGGRYDIVLARIKDVSRGVVPVAFVKKNGACVSAFIIAFPGGGATMTQDTNLCLGSLNDTVHVVTTNGTYTCGSSSIPVMPFLYGNFRLSIYGGGGADHISGGSGKDSIYGGAGNDSILGGASSEDYLFGESENDGIDGSGGSLSYAVGGGGNDLMTDYSGSNDELWGESGNDTLDSGCHQATLICGSGTDVAYYPLGRPFPDLTSCNTWNDLSC
jgi:Ca2+-binding RTX toxin-like protein